jgi:preprotein translocase subunit SecA
MDRLGVQEGEVITHSLVTKSIERSQRKVEGYNFEIRKRLIDYDDVMNKQREVIYGRRDEVMEADDLKDIIQLMVEDFVDDTVEEAIDPSELPENWPLDVLAARLEAVFLFSFAGLPVDEIQDLTIADYKDFAREKALEALRAREQFLAKELQGEAHVREFEKFIMLQNIDEKWMDHLHELDSLKEGIHYRAYAQKNPLVEYKREAFDLFSDLNDRIDRDALYIFFHARVSAQRESRADVSRARAVHRETDAYALGGGPQPGQQAQNPTAGGMGATSATNAALRKPSPTRPVTRTEEKVKRNDPCPCGSGKNHKQCCGRDA